LKCVVRIINRQYFVFSPLPPDELAAIIYEACGEDLSVASLTQVTHLGINYNKI